MFPAKTDRLPAAYPAQTWLLALHVRGCHTWVKITEGGEPARLIEEPRRRNTTDLYEPRSSPRTARTDSRAEIAAWYPRSTDWKPATGRPSTAVSIR